jgi:hypothetical protein
MHDPVMQQSNRSGRGGEIMTLSEEQKREVIAIRLANAGQALREHLGADPDPQGPITNSQ